MRPATTPVIAHPAIAAMDPILRAYAASPDIEDHWAIRQEYATEDGSIIVSPKNVRSMQPRTPA
ncbi:hypothetical protein GCM10018963_00350 [Saccharothrix longispora]